MNIWKIATRWSNDGAPNSSIIHIFRKYNIVFAGRNQKNIKELIKPNDIIAISDGIKVVSVGKVLDFPKKITDFLINKNDIQSGRFDYEDWVIGFKVSLFDLKEGDRFNYRQGTFHAVKDEYRNKVEMLFNKYNQNYSLQSKFSIDAKTCTLKYNLKNQKNIILDNKTTYIIPIYQRTYSWTEEQLNKFISDIFKSFYGYDRETPPEPMFIGTMQLSEKKYNNKNETEQNVIDGQQRLTTFLVLLKILKDKFPDNPELKKTNLKWIETRVNNGEQNKYLMEFIATDLKNIKEERQNPYIKNALIIKDLINEELTDDENNEIGFNIKDFIKHLFSNIYFVVIETYAGLSKTLQIFNAINTTGLDLNGGDIFKIRMYEYLTVKKGNGENSFTKINNLYAKIDKKNKEFDLNISITDILDVYKFIIISKNNLPRVLYSYNTDTFFDRLFDTIFNINQWKNFSNASNVNLCLSDIEKIIKDRYIWERMNYPTVEDECLMNLIWWSRYSKYWIIIFVFMFKYLNDENENKLFTFIKQLGKLYFIYSIRFQRSINDMHRFNHSLIDIIISKPVDKSIEFVNSKITSSKSQQLEYFISENLTDNRKRKDLVCRLSAMLEEDYKLSNNNNETAQRLFNWYKYPIDIEHIQSFNDSDEINREKIQQEWSTEINSLGNLMVLERKINRSISNKPYKDKIKEYSKSKYKIVNKQVKDYPVWSIENAKERKIKEVKKIYEYLFEQN